MGIEDALLDYMRHEANETVIKRLKNGEIELDNEMLPAFLAANIITSPDILDILEAMSGVIMKETMEKEYVVFFINKVREIANKERSF